MTLASLRTLAVAAFALGFAGCATADPELLTPDGRPLVDEPAAPYRVAVTPVKVPKAVEASLKTEPTELAFTIPTIELQQRLIDKMSELNAATQVFAAVDREAALANGADLVLVPRLRSTPQLAHNSLSGRWLLSGVLWITTWIGGMAVDDSTYDAKIELHCDLVNAHDAETPVGFIASSGLVDLGFWDRNDAMSLSFLSTLILPPFWTTDNQDVTSESLSKRAVAQVAGRMTSFLKFDLKQREKDSFGQVIFDTPSNGAEVGESVKVAGQVNARGPILGLRVERNGETVHNLGPRDLPAGIEQQDGSEFHVPLDFDVTGLRSGPNTIALKVRVGDVLTSRTLTVHRGTAASGPD